MSYQALYRIWRPQTFHDVVGQEHITRTLENAIVQGKFSHAYLFSGPRGTGKTSAAKIFAKAINCEHAPVKEPCNECDACVGIQSGAISDVIEMDAASNTSVDDIREIRDKVKYAPSSVPYKVYIIDEVHMISVNAFNALLKTLEEPPEHVVFILATTEPHKIPLTIISRCQRFDFKPIPNNAITGRMQAIIAAEGINATEHALETVALAAEGGMRDALSILDQAISYSNDVVELEDVLAVTGGVSQQLLTRILQSMYECDTQQSLLYLDELIQNGKDPGRFVFDLIYYLRDLLLYKSAPDLEKSLERAVVDEQFQALANTITADWVKDAILQLNKCQREMKYSNSPKVFVEITVLTITNKSEAKPIPGTTNTNDMHVIDQLTKRLEQMEGRLQSLKESPNQVQHTGAQRKREQPRGRRNSYKIPYEKIRYVLQEAGRAALKEVQSNWASFLHGLKDASAPAHATIQDSKPAAASENTLIVAFKYDIHCSLFLEHKEVSETILERLLGKHVGIIPIPAHNWQELRQEYIQQNQETTSKSHVKEKKEDPIIDSARKLVGDELLEIKDE